MKKKSLFAVMLACSLGLALTGCSQSQELTLSEQDQQLVTEYAVNVLMKYNAGSNMRVLSGQELLQAEAEEQARLEREAKRQQLAADYQDSQQTQETVSGSSTSAGSTSEAETIATIEDLGNFMALDQIAITYQNYEITDSYQEPDGMGMMAIDAGNGKSLLVAHFTVSNNSGETRHLDVLSQNGKFRLKADSKAVQSEYTLLLNDLSMYKGDIEAGASLDTVLIFEVSQEQAAAESLELIISMDGQDGSITIK
ncbi:MAG: hypothetical protein IJP31_11420 [Lachnospiraceae bacterium]|nr:hypothetical protein [Lachnospiraceae bacterium]